MSASPNSLAISWVLSTVSGYGIYGLHIAMQFMRRGGKQLILTRKPAGPAMPPLIERRLAPAFELATKLNAFTKENPEELLSFKHAVLHGCGNDFSGFDGQDKVWGEPNVGCAAIEYLYTTDYGRKIAKNYDMFIAISRWNAEFLRSLNIAPVHLCHQGIDGTLFSPGPRTGLYRDRFVIFSGGKFEFRKGQDIMLKAYKIFRERHPDALLITCWQNLTASTAVAFRNPGHIQTVPEAAEGFGLKMTPWILSQGLPPDSFLDLPFTHNLLMPSVLRECDVAIFPNRCEGGTNLVAMEAMACGVPTYVSYNTGQKDLVDLIGAGALRSQKPVIASPVMPTALDWGESDVDEIVEKLEYVYTHRTEAARDGLAVAEKMKAWEWGPLNEKLLRITCDGKAEAA
ncbi:MAG TPA: glycosyltransferase family 4 protein [Alphaproteobacteria bacterium]|nr:glycosyltransferase family 4 protein [Alphaproteobacteria bacterium]